LERPSMDHRALSLLTQDIDLWEPQGQRFAVAFLPETGHFPLPGASASEHFDSVVQRGRAVMARQDAFLGELMRSLEAHHRLEQTIIVVLADHGVRSTEEDPSLPLGMADEYSFHVPLLIYAPQVLNHTETVPWITSHIDIVPTLLDLLGVERESDFEQGSPIWDARLRGRTTFFFANHFFGADAYYSSGQFFMMNSIFNSVYQGYRLHFGPSDIVPLNSARYQEVSLTIRRMVGLQQTWAATLGRPRPSR
jgi:arylsulfatase A-like enzyme